jgi:pimeloyl-ACP methyl ester carboxylesterase
VGGRDVTREPERLVETPIWFGPSGHPLFGWLTRPLDAEVVGGLVVAPTLGREARASRRALRSLAAEAARHGLLVLRFDYDGTGDSSGSIDDPGRDEAWTQSVARAVELLRRHGVADVAGVGMRLGATILGAAVDRHDLDLRSLVLWDPCESGRTYLRELSALEALRSDRSRSQPDGAIVTAEFVFSPETAAELRRLDLTSTSRRPLASRLLVMMRADRSPSAKLRARLEAEPVEWRTSDDQGALLDVDPLFAELPERSIAAIVDWVCAGSTGPTKVVEPEDVVEPSVAVFGSPLGVGVIRERLVTLESEALFGIVTEPCDGFGDAPLVVLLNVANEDHTGPSRLWVELSRRWAAKGLRCVRFDLSGLGDSPARTDEASRSIYERSWLDDTVAVANELATTPSNVVLVGLCSGAYWAIEAGIALDAKGVCAINPPVGIDFLHGVTKLGASRMRAVRFVAEYLKQVALRARWVAVVVWKVLRLLAPSVFSVDVMRSLVDGGTDLQVLASSGDLSPVPGHRGLDRFFSTRLVAPANYEVTFVPGLDHSLHDPDGRAATVALLERHVIESFAPSPVTFRTGTANAEEHP